MGLKETVVKIKKLQKQGPTGLSVLIPKSWLRSNGWDQKTKLVLEFLPYQKKIIITDSQHLTGDGSLGEGASDKSPNQPDTEKDTLPENPISTSMHNSDNPTMSQSLSVHDEENCDTIQISD